MTTFDMRAVAYRVGGPRIGVLPDLLTATVTVPWNSAPTVNMTYPVGDLGVNGHLLKQEVEVGFELSYGNDWFEIPGGRFVSLKSTHSPLEEETGSQNFQAVHISRYLQEGLVWEVPNSEKTSDGKWNFKTVTAGMILKTLWDRAVSRGWGRGVLLNVTPSHDSAGAAWATTVTLEFDVSISLYQVLETLENLGMIDYQWDGRTLNVYNADTKLNRRVDVPWPLARGTKAAPESTSWESMCSEVLVKGEGGRTWKIKNNQAPAGMRRIEKIVEAGGVTQETTARMVARTALLEGAGASEEIVREWHGDDMVLKPFLDYKLGDWISVQRADKWDRLRVVQISLTRDADGMSGHTTFGTKLDDVLSRLAKRQKGIVGGAAIAGNTVRPAPERPKPRKPAAPDGVTARGDVVKNAQGFDIGVIEVGWTPVTTDAQGLAGGADSYEIRFRDAPQGGNPAGRFYTRPAAENHQGFVDNVDPGKRYLVSVRAFNEGIPGEWSQEVEASVPKDAEPPPRPSKPIAKTVFGVVVVNWNGTGSRGEGMPSDFAGAEYAVATPGGNLEIKAKGEGAGSREQRIAGLAAGDWDVAIRLFDRDGNTSAWSERTRVTVVSNVDADAIRRSLDEMLPGVENRILSKSERMQKAMEALATRGILSGEVPPDEGTVGKTLWVGPDGKVWRLTRKGS